MFRPSDGHRVDRDELVRFGEERLLRHRSRGFILFTLAASVGNDRWDRAQIVAQSPGSGTRKVLLTGGGDARYLPTGHLVYTVSGSLFAVRFNPRRLEVIGGSAPLVEGVKRATGFSPATTHFDVSATSTLIYAAGTPHIYVEPFPRTGERYLAARDMARNPFWSPSGAELLFGPPGFLSFQSVTVATWSAVAFGNPEPVSRGALFSAGPQSRRNYDPAPDGERILGVVTAEHAQSAATATPMIQVVLNWQEELKRLVPTR